MKKGISLVALVITIIVLIILTTTVILVFREGGTVDKAKEATFKSEFSNILDSFTLNKTNNMLNSLGNVNNINATTEEDLKSNIPILEKNSNKEINGHKYYKLIQIKDSVIYQSNMITNLSNEEGNEKDKEISKWLEEVGIKKVPKIVEANTNGDWEISKDETNKTCTITRYKGTGEKLNNVTIPEEIEGYNVIKIQSADGINPIAKFKGIIIIPYGVTNIDNRSFFQCSELTNIEIPTSVTNIGQYAFYQCNGLRNITIPYSVNDIGYSAFWGCSNLSEITIENGVETIGYSAFSCCPITNITIPSSVNSLQVSAFSSCDSLTEINVDNNNMNYSSEAGVMFNKDKTTIIKYPKDKNGNNYTIPNSVITIGESAFSCCTITNITIPSSVKNICSSAFYYCNGLTSITIPSSVTSIGSYAFYGCNKLTQINVDASNLNYSSIDGVLFNKNKTTIINYPERKEGNTYKIPDDVTTIDINAFYNSKYLTLITIPSSVITIEGSPFVSCNNLSNINVNWTNNEKPIGWNNFWNSRGNGNIPYTLL